MNPFAQDTAQLQVALLKLDTLSFATEPEDAGFGELMLTQSTLYLQANEPVRALKSWKLARQVVLPGQDENLKALCTQIRLQLKDSTLASDCNKIPVLAKQLVAALPPAPRSSSSTSAIAPVATSPDGAWVLQFGAFSSKENAELLLKNLKGRKVPSRLLTKNSADRVLYLVQTEPFLSKEAALQYGNSTLVPLGLDFQAVPNP
jgi:cell division septation protein DedD